MKVAEERRFHDYRTDVVLDVRQMRVALRRLRQLTRTGRADRARPRRDRSTRPAGTPARSSWCSARRAERRAPAPADGRRRHDGPVLRAGEPAAHRAARGARPARVPALLLPQLRLRPRLHAARACCAPTPSRPATCCAGSTTRWKVVIVGDAAMHPAELLEAYGGIDPRAHVADAGHRLAAPHRRPLRARGLDQSRASRRYWDDYQTTRVIRRLFPMFHLSVDGLTQAVQALVGARA